jgi:hypothetical protein
MTLDEIIEKVGAMTDGMMLTAMPMGQLNQFTTEDLKLLANHAKALKIAEAVLTSGQYGGVTCGLCQVHSKQNIEALQAISRIKEGRDK